MDKDTQKAIAVLNRFAEIQNETAKKNAETAELNLELAKVSRAEGDKKTAREFEVEGFGAAIKEQVGLFKSQKAQHKAEKLDKLEAERERVAALSKEEKIKEKADK